MSYVTAVPVTPAVGAAWTSAGGFDAAMGATIA